MVKRHSKKSTKSKYRVSKKKTMKNSRKKSKKI